VAAAALALAVFVDARMTDSVAAPLGQQVAALQLEPEAARRSVAIAAQMQELANERLQRRVRRQGIPGILRGAGHPHSAAFASDIEGAGEVALVGFGAR
jgi:hypothetical protein